MNFPSFTLPSSSRIHIRPAARTNISFCVLCGSFRRLIQRTFELVRAMQHVGESSSDDARLTPLTGPGVERGRDRWAEAQGSNRIILRRGEIWFELPLSASLFRVHFARAMQPLNVNPRLRVLRHTTRRLNGKRERGGPIGSPHSLLNNTLEPTSDQVIRSRGNASPAEFGHSLYKDADTVTDRVSGPSLRRNSISPYIPEA